MLRRTVVTIAWLLADGHRNSRNTPTLEQRKKSPEFSHTEVHSTDKFFLSEVALGRLEGSLFLPDFVWQVKGEIVKTLDDGGFLH